MAFSSGTFSRLHDWTTDRDAGIKISASRTDAEFDGIATGLTTCILKDGTQTLTAMIPFTLGLSVPTDKKIQLRDSAIFINSSGDGQLDVVADTEIELTAPTVDVAASTAVTIATPSLIITDNTTDEPIVQIKNTHNGTTAGELRFVMDKGAAGADGDDLGTISFYGDDAGQNQTAFAKIVGEVSEADETDEAGKLSLFVAESDGTNTALTAGLVLEGEHATDGEVDVTIGAGAASTTTVAGNLAVTTNAGIGITTPTFASGNGVHLADDFHLGFGNGNGTRPDFQLGYDATNTRLALKCGTGSDDTDFFFTTGGNIQQNGNNAGLIQEINNAHGSGPYGIRINFTAADPDNNDNYFLLCEANGNNKLKIFSDGDIDNHDNSYSGFSDERIKQDIVDSTSQWDDIKAIKVRNFKFKSDVTKYGDKAWSRIGVIAQELETVSPKLIKESTPDPSEIKINSEFGTLYEDGDTIPEGKEIGDVKEVKSKLKSVTYSILYMKAVKALQEAMTRIETLEAKVKALEEA